MARIRTIKPEFAQSQTMGRLSRDARLVFILLWTIADDAGRAPANSRLLASLLLPFDDDGRAVIEAGLSELEAATCIRRYSAEGNDYLDIPNWLKHQKIDHPTPSKIPEFHENSREPREDQREFLSNRTVKERTVPDRKGGEGTVLSLDRGEQPTVDKSAGQTARPLAHSPDGSLAPAPPASTPLTPNPTLPPRPVGGRMSPELDPNYRSPPRPQQHDAHVETFHHHQAKPIPLHPEPDRPPLLAASSNLDDLLAQQQSIRQTTRRGPPFT